MRFLHPERDETLELSLDDVFLVPGYFDGTSRLDVDLTPVDFAGGAHPIVSANMNAVTGKRMAETMARLGGLGVLPQDMELETAARIIRHIRAADPRYDTALAVSPRATMRDVLGIIKKRAHDMVIVVDDQSRPVGIVTHADLRHRDQYTAVGTFMSARMVTIPVGTSNRDAFLLMEDRRVKAVPVLDESGRLVGVLTRDDAVRLELLRPSLVRRGQLMVAAAVGISSDAAENARQLVELGASAVCTPDGTRALVEAGADVVNVNVVALYLAAGASRVMVGTALAGTYESPGDVIEDRDGRSYKENYGMASARAVSDRASGLDAFERAKKAFFREGISTSRVYIQEERESVGAFLVDMITGVQSAFTYGGATAASEFHQRAVIGVQTQGGYGEGKPRG